jgi:hypothetical protein
VGNLSAKGAPQSLIKESPWNRDTTNLFWRFRPNPFSPLKPHSLFNSNPFSIATSPPLHTHAETQKETEMEDGGIGLVLARATELRLKISNCIHKATPTTPSNGPEQECDDKEQEEEDDEEMERLLNICDALESLENQLSSLQVLASKLLFFLVRVFL